jgi:hypothetical protein
MVLAGCLIAVGVAAWSAIAAINDINPTDEPDNVSSYISSEVPSSEEPVQNEVSDVPYSEPSSTPEAESQPTNTKPVATYFVMPIAGSVEKDFDDKTLQYSATFHDMRIHLGVDIIAEKNASVVACGDGVLYDDDSRSIICENQLVIAGAELSEEELWENASSRQDSYHAFMSFGTEEEKRKAFGDLIRRQRLLFEGVLK